MDCREAQTLLGAFHDGELPAADRVRVEEHLRDCPGCATLLAGLARVDHAAGVPDPGPAYWDRFNARVMDRIAREADRAGGTVLRPKGGWIRQQLRYLVPAAAAAALVVVVVHYGGMRPVAPTPTAPPAASDRAAPVPAEQPVAKAEPETGAAKKAESAAVTRHLPPPAPEKEQSATVTREERSRPADRPPPSGHVEVLRDRATVPAAVGEPPPPATTLQRSPDGQGGPGPGAGGDAAGKVAPPAGSPTVAERHFAGEAKSASGMYMAKDRSASPCESARMLADRERWREAETAQRACLAQDPSAPAQEKGLVFLAELLDRQARFAEADAVLTDVDRQFPRSRPLDLYRQQRPMVQKPPTPAPGTR